MAKVNITMQDELLAWVDDFADANFTSRSGAITMMVNQFKVSHEMAETMKQVTSSLQKIANGADLTDEERLQLLGFEQLAKVLPGK